MTPALRPLSSGRIRRRTMVTVSQLSGGRWLVTTIALRPTRVVEERVVHGPPPTGPALRELLRTAR